MGGGVPGVRLVMLYRIFRSWPFSPTPSSSVRANIGRSRGGDLLELSRAAASVSVPSDSGTIDPPPLPAPSVVSIGYSRPQPPAKGLIFG